MTLKLYVASNSSSPTEFLIYQVNHPWVENSITWNNKPSLNSPFPENWKSSYFPTLPSNVLITLNITEFFNEWYVDGKANNGLRITTNSTCIFNSSENSLSPELIVTYRQ